MLASLCIQALANGPRDLFDSAIASPALSRELRLELLRASTRLTPKMLQSSDELIMERLPETFLASRQMVSLNLANVTKLDMSRQKGEVRVARRHNSLAIKGWKLPSLTWLRLSRNPIAATLVTSLAHKGLQFVDVSHTNVGDVNLQHLFAKSPMLTELLTSHTSVGDRAFSKLRSSYLLRLDVSSTRVTDVALSRISVSCPLMLNFSCDNLSTVRGAGVVALLNNLTSLTKLSMACCEGIEEETLLLVRNTGCRVRQLDLCCVQLSEDTLRWLFGCVFKDLRELDLSGVRTSLNVLKFVCTRNPSLESLILRGFMMRLTPKHLEQMQSLACLRVLELDLARLVDEASLIALLRAASPNLVKVSLAGVAGVTNKVLEAIALSAARLEKVNVSGCRGVTSLAPLLSVCSRLRMLGVKGCALVGDKATREMVQLIRENPDLEAASFSGLKACDARVVRALADLKRLDEVFISGTGASSSSISSLHRVRPRLRIVGW